MTVRYGRVFCSMLAVLLVGACAQQMTIGGPADSEGGPNPQVGGEWRTDGCGVPRSPEVVETGGAAMPLTPADLEAVLSRISQEGPARFADSYAGLEVEPEQVQAVVYRVPSAAFDAFVRAVAGNACVVVRDAVHTAAELGRFVERIGSDLEYWQGRGVRISSVGPIHDGSGVRVGTPDVMLAEVELPKRYGVQPPIRVEQEGQPQVLPGRSQPPGR